MNAEIVSSHNFIRYIKNNGCSIVCKFGDDRLLQLFTTNRQLLLEGEGDGDILDDITSFHIAILVARMSDCIEDPFSFNQETGLGQIIINNRRIYNIRLPNDIMELFISHNQDVNPTNDIINMIISRFQGNPIVLNTILELKNLHSNGHYIMANRNQENVQIGYGITFSN